LVFIHVKLMIKVMIYMEIRENWGDVLVCVCVCVCAFSHYLEPSYTTHNFHVKILEFPIHSLIFTPGSQ